MKHRLLILTALISLSANAQSWSTFLNNSRAIDWTKAGFTIPAYSTNCAIQPLLTANSSSAAVANTASIQAASASCDATHNVVNIPAGTYYIAGINFDHGFQVIRGAGANSTKLIATSFPPGNCAGEGSAICMLAPNWTYGGSSNVQPSSGSNQCSWSAGYAQGTTSITLSNCGGTPPNGQTIILDQANDTADTNGIYMCDGGSSNCTAEGTRNQGGRVVGGNAYSQQQVTKITGVTPLGAGSYTVTISPGVYFTNIRAAKSPGAWWPGFVQNEGLENLSLDSSSISGASGLVMFSCYQCWAKGVTFFNNARSAVMFYQTANSVVRDSYFYGAQSHASTSYNIEVSNSSANLIENNIMQQPTTTMIFSYSSAGNVVDYNFTVRNLFADGTWTWGIAASHGTGNNLNLFEGNDAYWIDGDNQSGPGTQATNYRNLYSGYEVGMPNASTPAIVSALDRDWNFVGNVLGTPGYHTTYQGYATSTTSFSGASTIYRSIYNLGAGGTGGACSLNAPQSTLCDPLTVSSLMRWGNYDVVNGATQWNSTEASPAANTYINANFSSSYFGSLSHSLPASLHFTSTPAWWPSGKAWPPIGPDVTAGNVGICSGGTYAGWQATSSSQCTGGTLTPSWASHAVSIPAMDCYLGTMGGPPDGSGNVLSFNASKCYTSTGTSGSSTASPSGLVATVD